jgi:hypothetical protein
VRREMAQCASLVAPYVKILRPTPPLSVAFQVVRF